MAKRERANAATDSTSLRICWHGGLSYSVYGRAYWLVVYNRLPSTVNVADTVQNTPTLHRNTVRGYRGLPKALEPHR